MSTTTIDRLTREAIEANHARLARHVRRTPILHVEGADLGVPDVRIVLKLESLQHTGSFKTRGAFTHLLAREAPPAGVAAASGGNHGAAVAYAAQRMGVPATIFVPTVASPAKIARIRGYGAELRVVGERYADALEACDAFVASSGALALHAYDQYETLLGQGGVGVEFLQDAPMLDAMLVAVGGGGLIGGIAAACASHARIVAVEPALAPTLRHALDAGAPVDAPAGGIAADSLAPRRIGRLPYAICERRLHDAVLVTDDAILDAQRALWEAVRIATEPGGATALAALRSGAFRPPPGATVGVVVCGANTTAVQFG